MSRSQSENANEGRRGIFSKKAVAAIVLIAICIAASVAGFFVLGFGRSPLDKVEDAVIKTAGALAERSKLLKFVYSLTDAESPGISIYAENIGAILSDITGDPAAASDLDADLKLDSAADKKRRSFVSARISSNGDDTVAGFYKTASGDTDAAFVMPGIIDDAYGFSINTMKEDLAASILAPGSESKYALGESDFEQIGKAVDMLQTLNQYISAEDMKELAAVIMESDAARLDFRFGKEEMNIGGEKIKVSAYKGILTTGTLEGALDVAARWLDRHYKLSALDMTFEEALDRITEDILENDLELQLEFDVCNGFLVRLKGAMDPFELSIDFGTDPAKTELIKAVVSKNDSDVYYDIDISGLENNELGISVYEDSGDVASVKIIYDESKESFRIQYDNDSLNVDITGDMKLDEGVLSIADPVITDSGHTFDLKGFSAEIKSDAGVRMLSDDFTDGYINIFTMDESDADNVLDNIFKAGQVMHDVIEVDFYNLLLSVGDLFR